MRNSALVYDLEIVKAIPDHGMPRLEGIAYCDGWGDYVNMGISVLCAYDYSQDRYRVFCADNLDEFLALCRDRQPIVSFNGRGFDNLVIKETMMLGAGELAWMNERSYDILAEIWERLPRRMKGYRLNDCSAANFHEFKTGNGAHAPVLWQQGKFGQVIDYCMDDVRLTKMLFDRILETGGIVDPLTMGHLALRAPVLSELGVPLA